MERKKKKKVCTVGMPPPHGLGGGSSLFIHEPLLDFTKENLVILVIKSLIPYQILILPYQGLILSGNNGPLILGKKIS